MATQRPWYASGARQLLESRQKGMAPTGPVVVTLIGGDYSDLAAVTLRVHADMPAERLDWRMLVNLEVWVWADATVALPRVLQILDGIARVRPKRLCLRFQHHAPSRDIGDVKFAPLEVHDIDIGDGYHHEAVGDIPATHVFHWSPVPIGDTALLRQLRNAMKTKHPSDTLL